MGFQQRHQAASAPIRSWIVLTDLEAQAEYITNIPKYIILGIRSIQWEGNAVILLFRTYSELSCNDTHTHLNKKTHNLGVLTTALLIASVD